MNTKKLRTTVMAAGTSLAIGGMLLAGGLPAFANEVPGPAPLADDGPGGIIFGDFAPEEIEAAVEVTGWPAASIYAGETVTLTMHVDSDLLGTPSLEGELVGLEYGGEILTTAALNAAGTAELSVRPLQTGSLEFTPFFAGDADGSYVPVAGDSGMVTVDEIPVTMTFWFDSETASGEVTAHGGGELTANSLVEPFCVDDEDPVVTASCYATYGIPSGSLVLMRDSTAVADVQIDGTAGDRLFADLGEDLSAGQTSEFVDISFTTPDILLGSPDSFEITAEFVPTNWFAPEIDTPRTVHVSAQALDLGLMVGEDWGAGPADRVNASSVLLTAFFEPAELDGAPVSGTITFSANGVSISEPIQLDPDFGLTEFDWAPVESGVYDIVASFTPDTLNHLPATSQTHTVTVTTPAAPNPHPNDATPADKSDHNKTLASTGGASSMFAGVIGGALLLLGTLALLLRRRFL